MGITARGAWVSAERQFLDLGINVDESEITVVGIGDMSGDVFGNGLLMSDKIQMVAAFNHQHIFIDPNPDLKTSFIERMRLFDLPRSTWDDYNHKLISQGGGVYLRSKKSINITPEVKQRLNITDDTLVPAELIKKILCAPVDLMWNGGIGTFVKAEAEPHESAGDRSNNAIRVNGKDLQTKVVCEGGNLGLTQLARIEYDMHGGKINTDFIDNSAGVDCSDHEVNIKILLNGLVNNGDLSLKQRNTLLQTMTDDVMSLVLQNNYHQNRLISLTLFLSTQAIPSFIAYMSSLEEEGRLDRKLEFLPSKKELLERKANGNGLSRPEISVLVEYSKITLAQDLLKTDITQLPYFKKFIAYAFPTKLRKKYPDVILKHRLYREIIVTQISNRLVSDMGITFVFQMKKEFNVSCAEVVKAYAAACEIFKMNELNADIESLDYHIDIDTQYQLSLNVIRLLRQAVRWLLRHQKLTINVQEMIDLYKEPVTKLSRRLPKILTGENRASYQQNHKELVAEGLPQEIAMKMAMVNPLYHSLNIVDAAAQSEHDVYFVAKIYFMLIDKLQLKWFRKKINDFPVRNNWVLLARAALKSDMDQIQRLLTLAVLGFDTNSKTVETFVKRWILHNQLKIEQWHHFLHELREMPAQDYAILAVAVRSLMDLAQPNG